MECTYQLWMLQCDGHQDHKMLYRNQFLGQATESHDGILIMIEDFRRSILNHKRSCVTGDYKITDVKMIQPNEEEILKVCYFVHSPCGEENYTRGYSVVKCGFRDKAEQ